MAELLVRNLGNGIVQYKEPHDLMWGLCTEEEFAQRQQPIEIITMDYGKWLDNKIEKPKELKGIKQFATIKKEGKYSVPLFIDTDNNLWYKDNYMVYKILTSGQTDPVFKAIYDNYQVKKKNKFIYGDNWTCPVLFSSAWFNVTGLYHKRHKSLLKVHRELMQTVEAKWPKNSASDNMALERLFMKMLKEYYAAVVQ